MDYEFLLCYILCKSRLFPVFALTKHPGQLRVRLSLPFRHALQDGQSLLHRHPWLIGPVVGHQGVKDVVELPDRPAGSAETMLALSVPGPTISPL